MVATEVRKLLRCPVCESGNPELAIPAAAHNASPPVHRCVNCRVYFLAPVPVEQGETAAA